MRRRDRDIALRLNFVDLRCIGSDCLSPAADIAARGDDRIGLRENAGGGLLGKRLWQYFVTDLDRDKIFHKEIMLRALFVGMMFFEAFLHFISEDFVITKFFSVIFRIATEGPNYNDSLSLFYSHTISDCNNS